MKHALAILEGELNKIGFEIVIMETLKASP